jgi:16S rRNA (cytosine1402-N4)-methyltransferase
LGIERVHAVLFDLGVSSMQLDEDDRGFSYSRDVGLDMRMNPLQAVTAATVLAEYSAADLTRILRVYGEERFAQRIASAIVRRRESSPLTTTGELAALVASAVPAAARRKGSGHPAKKTFQAVRIEVNAELDVLTVALPAAIDALRVDGRIAVLSYHSLEDRITKQTLAGYATTTVPDGVPVVPEAYQPSLKLLTRGADKADAAEILDNPRARSARLRAAVRIKEAA